MSQSSTGQQLGFTAGVVVAALLVAVTFVGPWRVFTVQAGGSIPIGTVDDAAGNPFLFGFVATLLVAFVTGSAYPDRAGDEEFDLGEMTMAIFVPPMGFILVGLFALFLAPAGETLLSGAVVDAAVQALVGIVFAVFLSGTAGTVAAVYIGIPALVGVYAGVLVGRVVAPD